MSPKQVVLNLQVSVGGKNPESITGQKLHTAFITMNSYLKGQVVMELGFEHLYICMRRCIRTIIWYVKMADLSM